jgi:hypothetical protein
MKDHSLVGVSMQPNPPKKAKPVLPSTTEQPKPKHDLCDICNDQTGALVWNNRHKKWIPRDFAPPPPDVGQQFIHHNFGDGHESVVVPEAKDIRDGPSSVGGENYQR